MPTKIACCRAVDSRTQKEESTTEKYRGEEDPVFESKRATIEIL
jgi:hypothetical protein